jgi:hypothetical protein
MPAASQATLSKNGKGFFLFVRERALGAWTVKHLNVASLDLQAPQQNEADVLELSEWSAVESKIVSAPNGRTLVVWTEKRNVVDPYLDVYARTTIAGNLNGAGRHTWSGAFKLGTSTVADASNLDVVMNEDGHAMAVWRETGNGDAGQPSIQAARFRSDPSGAWGWEQPVSLRRGAAGIQTLPKVAVDRDGGFLVVWNEAQRIAGARASAASVWSDRFVVLEGQADETMGMLAVAGNRAGRAVIVAQATKATGENRLWSVRAQPGMAFGEREAVKHETVELEYSLQLAMDSAGHAVAAWAVNRLNGQNDVIYVNHLNADAGWGNEFEASPSNTGGGAVGDASAPRLVMDDSGNAMLSWTEESPTQPGRFTLWTSRYERGPAASAWRDTRARPNAGANTAPQALAVDKYGRVLRVWAETDGANPWGHAWDVFR